MIVPIKCFTCGKVLADKYLYYTQRVNEIKTSRGLDVNDVIYMTKNNIKKTPEAEVMDELHLNKICCRRHMLTHIDIY
jgi:DNA-directed RNA polymerase subunit N (RpoN/RPB10)